MNRGQSLYELRVGSELDLTRGRNRLAALLHLGGGQPQHIDFKEGESVFATTSLWRLSPQAGLAFGRPTGPGVIEIALQLGVDLLFAKSTTLSSPGKTSSSASSWKVTPTAEVRVGYRVALVPWMFLRPQAGFGSAIVGYDIRRDAANRGTPDILTPTWFSTLALDVGFVFR
ncbi:MAG TPA: hypothetical protein VIU64_05830 [Polyangia bacterium]